MRKLSAANPSRLVFLIGLHLLIGAMVNVLVAWGWLIWQERNIHRLEYERVTLLNRPEPWPESPPTDWPAPNLRMQWHGTGFLNVDVSHFDYNPKTAGWGLLTHEMTILQVGWPMTALRWRVDRDMTYATVGTFRSLLIGGVAVNRYWSHKVRPGVDLRLPLVPVWPGFFINTLVYAGVAAPLILFSARRTVGLLQWIRGRLRQRRGLCPDCAYPIGTSPVCTECGALVEKSKASRR